MYTAVCLQELRCLQEHYKELDDPCRVAVREFTQEEDKDVQMDKQLMHACSRAVKTFCKDMLGDASTKPGDVMTCLIKSKQEPDMPAKCRAGIEHHQLLTLTDYRFSFKLKQACKDDVTRHCAGEDDKSGVVRCLSQMIRDDVLRSAPTPRVSAACQHQVTFELLQRVGGSTK